MLLPARHKALHRVDMLLSSSPAAVVACPRRSRPKDSGGVSVRLVNRRAQRWGPKVGAKNLYKRREIWWARFQIEGNEVRRSLRTTSEEIAKQRLASLLETAVNPEHRAASHLFAAESERAGGYVYFVQAQRGGPIKIGHTRAGHPQERLISLQVGSPVRLKLLGCLKAPRKVEAMLHERFASSSVQGEWFKSTPRLRRLIAELCDPAELRPPPRLEEWPDPRSIVPGSVGTGDEDNVQEMRYCNGLQR